MILRNLLEEKMYAEEGEEWRFAESTESEFSVRRGVSEQRNCRRDLEARITFQRDIASGFPVIAEESLPERLEEFPQFAIGLDFLG